MTDAALRYLLASIPQTTEPTLWFADENALDSLSLLPEQTPNLSVITNRFDVSQQMLNAGLNCRFNDFESDDCSTNQFQQVFYRISKEKPVTHHIINSAFKLLRPGGDLVIYGEKGEGIKSYADKAKKLFQSEASLNKQGKIYSAVLHKQRNHNHPLWLEDKNYPQLRTVAQQESITFYSKPGVYGWDKIDQGSAFLIAHMPEFLARIPHHATSLLDLGCGYGYLTCMTKNLPLSHRVATDNNAGALIAAQHNFTALDLTVEVVADDCAKAIKETFDVILCNPPFHQGFTTTGDLTDKFLHNTQRLLANQGAALFVINQFIPLQRKASRYFKRVETLAKNKSFQLVFLSHN